MRHLLCLVLPMLATLPAFARDKPSNPLIDAPSHFAKSGDLKVHYKSLGEGKTALVFVHGWCGDHTVWTDQAAALNGKLRMLFVDLPGYGRSDKPQVDYTPDLFADGLNAVLKDAGVEKAVLAGHSMGTPVVRQFYRRFPDQTKALIFVDGGLRPFTTGKAATEKFLSMFQEDTFKESVPQFFGAMFSPDCPASVRESIEKLALNATPSVAVNSMKQMFDEKWWKEDPVKVPSLALMAKSPFWNDDYKTFVKKLVPDLDYREFDGVGHFLFLEKPKEVNEVLSEFLKKQGLMK